MKSPKEWDWKVYVIGVLVALVIGMASWGFSNHEERIQEIKEKQEAIDKKKVEAADVGEMIQLQQKLYELNASQIQRTNDEIDKLHPRQMAPPREGP